MGDVWPFKRTLSGCEATVEKDDNRQITRIKTPAGDLESVSVFDESTNSWTPHEMPVKDEDDLDKMILYFRSMTFEAQPDYAQKSAGFRAQAEAAGKYAVLANLGQSPLMHFIELIAGLQEGHFFLIDCEEKVQELFEAMHQVNLQKAKIMAEGCEADLICLYENTSSTMISPDQYEKYCMPHLIEYAEIFRDAGKKLILHMCGHIDGMIEHFVKVPAWGYEAITTPPVGNTHLERVRAQTDKLLIGGSNACLWMKEPDEIIAGLEQELDALPHHRGLVLNTGGELPQGCPPETLRKVQAWIETYPVK